MVASCLAEGSIGFWALWLSGQIGSGQLLSFAFFLPKYHKLYAYFSCFLYEIVAFQNLFIQDKSCVTAVAIGDDHTKFPYSPLAAWHFVKLLTKTNLPPSLVLHLPFLTDLLAREPFVSIVFWYVNPWFWFQAIELVTGLRLHIHYQIGFGSAYGSLVNNVSIWQVSFHFSVTDHYFVNHISPISILSTGGIWEAAPTSRGLSKGTSL